MMDVVSVHYRIPHSRLLKMPFADLSLACNALDKHSQEWRIVYVLQVLCINVIAMLTPKGKRPPDAQKLFPAIHNRRRG